jgi:glucose/mannose-6-phosphate isomerase
MLLNDVKEMKLLDPGDMLGIEDNLPDQCERAWDIAGSFLLPEMPMPEKVVVTGLGGSAISGDIMRALVADQCSAPVVVNRDYTLPAFVNGKTLVFVDSYSGNTEETLSAYGIARARGAMTVCITTGGKLKEMAQADNSPVITIPAGQPPRTATGYILMPMLNVMQRMGLIAPMDGDVAETVSLMRSQRENLRMEVEADNNPAKQLALMLENKMPLVYGNSEPMGVMAFRWKCQFNENSKIYAGWNAFPELNHNEIMAWSFLGDLTERFFLVMLSDEGAHPRLKTRVSITEKIMRDRVGGIHEIKSQGESLLARMMSVNYIGDYTTLYLALLYNADPMEINAINHLKAELAKV